MLVYGQSFAYLTLTIVCSFYFTFTLWTWKFSKMNIETFSFTFLLSIVKNEYSWNFHGNLNWKRFDGSRKMVDGIMDFVCAYFECNQEFLNWYVQNAYSKDTALDLMDIKWQSSRFLMMKMHWFSRGCSDMICSIHNESDERPTNWNKTEAKKESQREREGEMCNFGCE